MIRTLATHRANVVRTFLIACIVLLAPTISWSQAVTITITKTSNAPHPVESGVPFTYSIGVSWSGGVPANGTIVVTDLIPPQLEYLSSSPITSGSGNTRTLVTTGLTNTAGSLLLLLNVRFKPGVTCPGTVACNTARAGQGTDPSTYVTSNMVCDTAKATNMWILEKTRWTNCSVDAMGNNHFTYRIVIRNATYPYGMNLDNVKIYEQLPDHATINHPDWQLAPPVPNRWEYIGNALNPNRTLNVLNNYYVIYVPVVYGAQEYDQPGVVVPNSIQMTYRVPCDSFTKQVPLTASANATICAATTTGGGSKTFFMPTYNPNNGSYTPSLISPNCCGTYGVSYTNSGSSPQAGLTITDNMPHSVDLSSISVSMPAAMSVVIKVYSWSGGVGGSCGTSPSATSPSLSNGGTWSIPASATNICKVEWTYTGTLSSSASVSNYMAACIRSTDYVTGAAILPGTFINNVAIVTATGLSPAIQLPHTMMVDVTTPAILLSKSLVGACTPSGSSGTASPNGPWYPGDIIRWRIAVSNMGNAVANNCVISDLLAPGFSYVGNERYYYGAITPANQNIGANYPPCGTVNLTNPPAGIGSAISHTLTGSVATGQTVTWNFPQLQKDCDGTPSYFILEFDVQISSAPPVPPGTFPNRFTFSATNSNTVTSQYAYVVVNTRGVLYAIKEVRALPDGVFSSTATIPPGGTGEFRLTILNTLGSNLQNLCVLDIMPHVGDVGVLPPYSGRMSDYDIVSHGSVAATPSANFTTTYNVGGTTKAPMRTPCAGFCEITSPSGAQTWVPGTLPASGTYSFSISANSGYALAPGATFTATVPFTVPLSATPGDVACNSFAYQCNPVGLSTCLSAEPTPACVTVGAKVDTGCGRCDSISILPYDFGGNNLSGRTFTVHNLKNPASPIMQVKIALSPLPLPSGGQFQWNGGPANIPVDVGCTSSGTASWGINSSYSLNPLLPYYSRIDMACPGAPSAPQGAAAECNVSFNLGVDRSLDWVGTATITVIHCDGDSCEQTFEWCARQIATECPGVITPNSDVVIREQFNGRLIGGRFLVVGDRNVRISHALITPDTMLNARVFALGAPEHGLSAKNNRSMAAIGQAAIFSSESSSRYAARVDFPGGIRSNDTVEIPFVVEVPTDANSNTVNVRVVLFDEHANVIYEDTATAGAVLDVDDLESNPTAELKAPSPAPANGVVRFAYYLNASESISLDIYDAVGNHTSNIDFGQRNAGDHSVSFDTKFLPSGAYLVRLKTSSGSFVRSIIVQH